MAHMTPYSAPLDSTLEQPVLDGRNGGEESMMSFVRHHILTTLEPLSAELRELKQQVAHMAKDQALTDTKVEEHGAALRKVDNDMLAVRNGNNDVTGWMKRAQIEMQKEAEERAKVQSDVDATKQTVARANERHQHCMSAVEGVDRKLAHLNSNFGATKDLLAVAEANIQAHDKKLAQLQDAHSDLVTHHTGAAQKLQRAAEHGEMLERNVQQLMASHQHHCEETIVTVEDLDQQLKQVRGKLDSAVDLADKDRMELKQTGEFVKSMRQNLGHKDNTCHRLDSMQSRDEEMYNALKKHLEAYEHLQRLVEGLSGGPLSGGDGSSQQRGSGTSDLLDELRVRVDAHDQNIDKMGSAQAQHVEQIKATIMAIEKLQRDSQRLKQYADATQQELAGLVTSHKQANSRMESHTIDHTRLQSDVQNVTKDVDSNIKQVKGDLGNTSAALARLRSHHDAANTNMFGLAKGFQDAGRHVISADGGRSGTMSPALRPLSTMRTPRGPAQAIDAARQQLPFSP